MRMPLTCWAWFITAILGLLAFGVLLAAGILLLMDRNLGTSFFVPGGLTVTGKLIKPQRRLAAACGSTCSGSSDIPRFTSPSCRAWVSLAIALHLLAQADFRIQGDGLRHHGHRPSGLYGLGPSHVHERHEPLLRVCVLDHDHGHRRAFGHQDLQLAGHDCTRAECVRLSDALRHRFCFAVCFGRTERPVPGAAGARHPVARHLFRGRRTST